MHKTASTISVLTVACLIFTYAAVPGSTAAPRSEEPQAAAPASATEAQVGLGLEKLELTGASDSFKVAPDTKIYGWARVRGVAPGSNVSIVFSKGDKEVYKKEIPVPSVPYRINAYRTFRAGDAGEWKLTIVGPEGKELAAAPFKVEVTK